MKKFKSYFYILYIFLLFIYCTYCQSSFSTIKIVNPTDCLSTQYYDISRLECRNCPTNSQKSDLYNCRCNEDYYFTMNSGGGSISCQKCPSNKIQSSDGFSCVECNDNCRNCLNLRGFRSDINLDGSKYLINGIPSYQCVTCNIENSILSNNKCSSCKPLIFTESDTVSINSLTCNQNYISLGGLLISNDGLLSIGDYLLDIAFDSELVSSYYFRNYLISSHRTCRQSDRRNVTSCQLLANLCVLSLYTTGSTNAIDACKAYYFLRPQSQNTVYYDNLVPWLVYPISLSSYTTTYLSSGLGNGQFLKLDFNDKCKSTTFKFYASQFNLNGSLNHYSEIDISKFQLCNYLTNTFSLASKVSPFSATNYIQTCDISVSSLIDFGSNPIFYDLYLKYNNDTNLLPIPVKVLNYKEQNTEVNRVGLAKEQVLHRRFFLVDSISSKSADNSAPKYVRYAKTFKIYIQLFSNENQGRIYPPIIEIDYAYVSTDKLDKTVPITFQIQYDMKYDIQNQAVWISIGILSAFSIVWSIMRTWIWNRRAGKLAPDLITLFKFIMFVCSSISNVFFIVLVAACIYWLIIYKGQGLAYFVIPTSDQEETYRILIIVAFALKLIDVIHLVFTQTSYDIFFIDWERPKVDSSNLISNLIPSIKMNDKNKDSEKENLIRNELKEYNKISCWRTLFVANEWNEIQTFRKIDPSIQLICVLFLLKVINLEAITTSDCNTSIVRDANAYQAPYSGILRIAMAASMYIGVGVLQYIVYLFIYIRCIQDRIGQFIDFCSVSNISMFIMTHTQYGYYIHGRSPHGYSDISMQQMAQALLKEENDITGKRGLEQNSDQQTFSISISSKLSNEYAKVMIPIFEKKGNRTKSGAFSTSEFEKRILAYSHLNKFLMGFIDNILRNLKYIIVKRNFIENVFNLEFKEPTRNGYFYADENKSFEKVLFSGQERKLFVFDLLAFLFVDFFAKNYVLAAFVVYVLIKIYNALRNDLGRRNISRKTLVDKRFLI